MEINSEIVKLDLSKDIKRQTIVDKEDGRYLGHVTSERLDDGSIMIAYPLGHGRGQIALKKSVDGGVTWSDRLPVPDSFSTSLEVPTIHRVIDSEGNRRLILFSGLYPVRMSVSVDEGDTWSELEPIGDFGGIVTMADLVQLSDGRYMGLFHDDDRMLEGGDKAFRMQLYRSVSACGMKEKIECFTSDRHSQSGEWSVPQVEPKTAYESSLEWEEPSLIYESIHGKVKGPMKIYKVLSDDGGLTWGKPSVVTEHDEALLCEPGAVRSPDGKQIAVLIRENSRKFHSFVIFSDDEGDSWSELRELPLSLTGDRHTIKYAPDGRLIVTFRDISEGSDTYGDWVAWVGTYDDIVEGKEGQYRVRLMESFSGKPFGDLGDCAYPGLEVLEDGTAVAVTYGQWEKDHRHYIASVRFTLEELDELAKDIIND